MKCAICGNQVVGIYGTINIAYPSLDLRGGDGFYRFLHPDFNEGDEEDEENVEFSFIPSHCHSCGYATEEITEELPRARELIKTARYKEIFFEGDSFISYLDHSDAQYLNIVPNDAVFCNAAAFLYEEAREFGDAALQSLYAAWVCDDTKGKKRQAIRFRKQALSLIEKMRKQGKFLRNRQDVTELITVDLLRRSKQFDVAILTADKFLKTAATHGNPLLKNSLQFEKTLSLQKDGNAHSILEIIPHWNSILFSSFTIAGIQYRQKQGFVRKQRKMMLNRPVSLVAEPQNEHDKNAIAIYWNDLHIGYVPRRRNREVGALLKAGYEDILFATVTDIDPDEYIDRQIVVTLSILEKNPPDPNCSPLTILA